MSDKVNRIMELGAMAEGSKCGVYARRVDWKGLRKDPITHKPMTLYELDRNCSTEVVEEMAFSEDERSLRISLGVHTAKGDKLTADAVQLYVDTKRNNVRFIVREGQTSTHGGSIATTQKRTVGRIKTPIANYQSKFALAYNRHQKEIGSK